MIYSKNDFQNLDDNAHSIAVSRYLTKILRGETKKLLPHECEFICSFLNHLYLDKDVTKPAHDVYQFDFLGEALFKRLVLVYLDNLDFLKPVSIGHRDLTVEEILRDRLKFNELLANWDIKLRTVSSNIYLHEVRIEYHRKLKILSDQFKQLYFGRRLYERRILEQKVAAFYKYFITKSFFKNNKQNWVQVDEMGKSFVINPYSYVHIISRHYMPKFNSMELGKSFNNELSCIDPFNLPNTLRDLIVDYFNHAPAKFVLDKEYMIFSQDADYYMVWWKQKQLNELNQQIGYEIRTLYKIDQQRDHTKINHSLFYEANNRIKYFY
ncbi:hypothetical protein SRABI27_04000 [Pedobacter sp. Bi27]|uniref:hypothetical protein n=1 Tax=Pedobacter sp. Bi27 TaxID=2822351 RepID=UPI001D5A8F88|nr:hypothetical protein [Pedobacter sp. Bi27]CAH0288673.1 hypothetical protein SRABI27_04000 [Pedobacter sp. Bi27]